MKKKISFLIIFNFFIINLSFASNIAFIDLNFIINNSIVGKNVISKLERINNNNLDALKKEQIYLNDQKEQIDKTRNILSKEELDNKISILNNEFQNFNKKQELMSKEFNELKQTEMSDLLDKINPIIEKYMIENMIDLMLKKENVYISKSQYNVSKEIIELINKDFSNWCRLH